MNAPRRVPPQKQRGKKTGPRSWTGGFVDVATLAARLGVSAKQVRAEVARGLLPYRRRGGRILFVPAEIDRFHSQLPGVSVEQALANVAARQKPGR